MERVEQFRHVGLQLRHERLERYVEAGHPEAQVCVETTK